MSGALHVEKFRAFSPRDHETWSALYRAVSPGLARGAHPIFIEGLRKLGISDSLIPDLDKVNARLMELTGWRGVPVTGLEEKESFYPALARREFPIGNFIRDRDSLGYTPAPDVFHDLFGHIPFFADENYARYCEAYGQMTLRYMDAPEKLQMLERFFWFSIEFGLCETPQGRRIFGAGILSSRDESAYALSTAPLVHAFDVSKLIYQDFRIDQIQPVLFVLKSPQQLYESLDVLEASIQ